jgi:hypothetical protein
MHSPLTLKQGVPVTPLQYEEFDSQLELICRTCHKEAKYAVGRIFIEPEAARGAAE